MSKPREVGGRKDERKELMEVCLQNRAEWRWMEKIRVEIKDRDLMRWRDEEMVDGGGDELMIN